ncbi:MAG: HDOD domain-containing protein [Rubrivivax sp.]
MLAPLQTPGAEPAFIVHAPKDVPGWARLFRPEYLPVLGSTAATLENLRLREDDIDARTLAEPLGCDPLMTLKLLAHVGQMRRTRREGEAETVTASLVMLGISPFFRAFGRQPTVEEHLRTQPEALEGFRAVLRRAHRAADFALGFAVHRHDHDAAVIYEAALLHDFAELLLWLQAPGLALEIARRQRADAQLRSEAVQREVLNIRLVDLQHELMTQWRLPSLLVRITDHGATHDDAQVRNVLLAIQVARHSAGGWDNAAIPDDLHEIADLLKLGVEPTLRLLREIDQDEA